MSLAFQSRRFSSRVCLFVVALAFVGMPISNVSADVFTDDFDMGASSLWQNDSGNWTAAGGSYGATVPDNFPNAHSTLLFDLANFVVEVDINNVSDGGVWLRSEAAPGTTIGRTGVLLVTGANVSGLFWHNVTDGDNYGAAHNIVGGLFTSGVSDPSLRIEVAGDDYSVFVDGSSTAATTLSTSNFSSGQVGLYDNSGQTFDNFSVTVPEPSSTFVLVGVSVAFWNRRRRRS